AAVGRARVDTERQRRGADVPWQAEGREELRRHEQRVGIHPHGEIDRVGDVAGRASDREPEPVPALDEEAAAELGHELIAQLSRRGEGTGRRRQFLIVGIRTRARADVYALRLELVERRGRRRALRGVARIPTREALLAEAPEVGPYAAHVALQEGPEIQ